MPRKSPFVAAAPRRAPAAKRARLESPPRFGRPPSPIRVDPEPPAPEPACSQPAAGRCPQPPAREQPPPGPLPPASSEPLVLTALSSTRNRERKPVPFRWRSKGERTAPRSRMAQGEVRVVMCTAEDFRRNKAVVEAVLERLDDALGDGTTALDPSGPQRLFIAACRVGAGEVVCGAVVAEELQRAWRMVGGQEEQREVSALETAAKSSASSTQVALAMSASLDSESTADTLPPPGCDWADCEHFESLISSGIGVICGISRIWVDADFRRRGVASRMVEEARKQLIFGYEIPPTHLAFSQPTRDGKLFAKYCTGRCDFFVYS